MRHRMIEKCQWAIHCNDSIELTEQLTFIQGENHIITQPNTEPMFLHKFGQFYPFIQK